MDDGRLIRIHWATAFEQGIGQHGRQRFTGPGIKPTDIQFLHRLLDFGLVHKPTGLLMGFPQAGGLFARQVTKLLVYPRAEQPVISRLHTLQRHHQRHRRGGSHHSQHGQQQLDSESKRNHFRRDTLALLESLIQTQRSDKRIQINSQFGETREQSYVLA